MATVKLVKDGSTPVEVRASPSTPLGGMRPDIDAAALDRTDFVQLQNIRRIGPSLTGRPGQSLFYGLGSGYEPTGLGEFPIGAQRRLLVVADGCPGVSAGAGFSLSSYSLEQSPRFQPLVYRPAATSFCAARFIRSASVSGLLPAVDAVMFAADGVLYRLSNVPFVYGSPALPQSNGGQEVPVWTVPTGYTSITAMMQHGSELILAVTNGVGTSAIFSWDGLTFRREVDAINPVTGFGLYRGTLIAGHNGAPNLIRVRSDAGVWSTVAPGAGTVGITGNYLCASYRDVFYIPYGDSIFSFDGTTLTQIPAATNGVTAGATIRGLEKGFGTKADPAGFLFYSWQAAGPSQQKIGRFDGTTWVPAHKNILAQLASTTGMRGLRAFSGNLMAGGIYASGFHIFQSPRTATNGTYTDIEPWAVTNSADVRELLLY